MPVQATLHLGEAPPVTIDVPEQAWVGPAADSASDGEQLQLAETEIAAVTQAALEAPRGYPALTHSLVTGDCVAIALGADVRSAGAVTRGVVAAILAAGIEAESVVIVAGNQADVDWLAPQLTDLFDQGCRITAHDPADETNLCYIAAVGDKPLLMNRELFEADVVIPVGCARLATARDYLGPYDAIFPRFGDAATIGAYHRGDALDSPTMPRRRQQEADRAGWLLGAPLVVQVVPAPGGGVARVEAGAPAEVREVVEPLCDRLWTRPLEGRAALVVATVAGGPREQSWTNVARALQAAAMVADDEDSIVAVCTEIDTPPGEALGKLIAAEGDLERAGQLGDERSPDAWVAWELYKSLCRGPVFFMSRLDPETVEELGMAPIANPRELSRLVTRSGSCVILDEAQHVLPKLIH